MYNQHRLKHGDASHKRKRPSEYIIWEGMKRRCCNPTNKQYPMYGGKGIKVCRRWRESYESFLEDMGRRPSVEYTLERVNNEGNYEPCNCIWATRKEQANNRRNNRFLFYNGQRKTTSPWTLL